MIEMEGEIITKLKSICYYFIKIRINDSNADISIFCVLSVTFLNWGVEFFNIFCHAGITTSGMPISLLPNLRKKSNEFWLNRQKKRVSYSLIQNFR
jgi:hypothetical protein